MRRPNPFLRLLLPLLLALSLLAGSEGKLTHEFEHEFRAATTAKSFSALVVERDACLTCAAYAPFGASLLSAGALPPLLAFAAILAASAFAALHLPFAALFRSRAPPVCC
ncbi:MAG: hypothetical protein U1F63_15365 [Chitinivorax sp.]